MLYLNDNEKLIIERFMQHQDQHYGATMLLSWRNMGTIVATYDLLMEDENEYDLDDLNYEEFWSFAFHAMNINGNPPVSLNQQNNFLINYHNFPDEIIADGKKIN